MQAQLRYISISHQNASTALRQLFHLSEEEQQLFSRAASFNFEDVGSLMILSTCNRMEVYFESQNTESRSMLHFLLSFKSLTGRAKELSPYFAGADNTFTTAFHLLKVANGLESRIIGDAQIMQQVKEAYAQSVKARKQGKLLERSIQSAFRLHKRISNETLFRSGTVSFAYLSLKNIQAVFGKENIAQKRLLIIGAGEIAEEVAKYSVKFPFREVAISNRTGAKAEKLAAEYQLQTVPWELVENHQFQAFDAVISCVSNRRNLLKSDHFLAAGRQIVLVDLAMPANIMKPASEPENVHLFDLDTLAEVKDAHKANREVARIEAEKLLFKEIDLFTGWVNKIPVHQALQQFRFGLEDEIRSFLLNNYHTELSEELIREISSSLARKISRKPAKTLTAPELNGDTTDYLKIFSELF